MDLACFYRKRQPASEKERLSEKQRPSEKEALWKKRVVNMAKSSTNSNIVQQCNSVPKRAFLAEARGQIIQALTLAPLAAARRNDLPSKYVIGYSRSKSKNQKYNQRSWAGLWTKVTALVKLLSVILPENDT